jgi:ATP/maltotriose-dependent transcriptional regulator MalT
VNTLDCPVTWLSLDPADDDPGRFFAYLVAALQKVDPNLGREIAGVLRSGQLPPCRDHQHDPVKAIYGKLNVSNRTQAIEIARQLRIV